MWHSAGAKGRKQEAKTQIQTSRRASPKRLETGMPSKVCDLREARLCWRAAPPGVHDETAARMLQNLAAVLRTLSSASWLREAEAMLVHLR